MQSSARFASILNQTLLAELSRVYTGRENFFKRQTGVEQIGELLPLESMLAYASSPKSMVKAIALRKGQTQAPFVSPQDVRSRYENGETLYIIGVQRTPVGRALYLFLKRALRLGGQLRLDAFLGQDGGLGTHLDLSSSLTFQIQGVKTWWVGRHAPQIADFPARARVDPQSGPQWLASEPQPEWPPAPVYNEHEMDEYRLEPGALLYVMPGVWHRTEVVEAHYSLTFGQHI